MTTDYQIILIVITIIGFIISIMFYIYFVYIPATRAASNLDIIAKQGEDAITLVEDRIQTVKDVTAETLLQTCKTICQTVQAYNSSILGPPCPLTQSAIPAYCDPAIFNLTTCGT